ncbi:MAG: hypothetical protein HQK83_00710 [Fibrobacteria bacterium]|nr:hypothetical protein [Fibrobacteria bacterium]
MKYLLPLLCLILFFSCSSSTKRKKTYTASRFKIERPGKGVKLDDDITKLLRENKRNQAKKLCNDILFTSRSPKDRETANFWKAIIGALEEIDENNYRKAASILENSGKWLITPHKEYHISLVIVLLTKMAAYENRIIDLDSTVQRLQNIEQLNFEQQKEIVELRLEKEKLHQLLIDLDRVDRNKSGTLRQNFEEEP